MTEKIHPTLIELWIGILFWSGVIAAIGVWFCENKPAWFYGILFGAVAAMALAFYMYRSVAGLVDDLDAGRGDQRIRASAMIRLLASAAVIAVACVVPFLNPIGTFLGLLSMKFAAYSNPVIHALTKRMHPYFKDKEYPPEEDEDAEAQIREIASEPDESDEKPETAQTADPIEEKKETETSAGE